jgi:hypothetical protein
MNIHLVEPLSRIVRLQETVWESGGWVLDESKAQELVGGEIYFHKKRPEPSFYGGTILGYRVLQEGTDQGRIVFKLQYRHTCRNVSTKKSGWVKDMKITEPDGEADSPAVNE